MLVSVHIQFIKILPLKPSTLKANPHSTLANPIQPFLKPTPFNPCKPRSTRSTLANPFQTLATPLPSRNFPQFARLRYCRRPRRRLRRFRSSLRYASQSCFSLHYIFPKHRLRR